jgi:hypothetical protein
MQSLPPDGLYHTNLYNLKYALALCAFHGNRNLCGNWDISDYSTVIDFTKNENSTKHTP